MVAVVLVKRVNGKTRKGRFRVRAYGAAYPPGIERTIYVLNGSSLANSSRKLLEISLRWSLNQPTQWPVFLLEAE